MSLKAWVLTEHSMMGHLANRERARRGWVFSKQHCGEAQLFGRYHRASIVPPAASQLLGGPACLAFVTARWRGRSNHACRSRSSPVHATNCKDRKMRTTSVAYLDRDGQRTYIIVRLANESEKWGVKFMRRRLIGLWQFQACM